MTFGGFRPELLTFLSNLKDNNSREWFQAHRLEYEQLLLEPARQLVIAMGEQLKTVSHDIHAEPKVHGSIFAINRDTRFSPNKTPYKTHLDLWFWQGPGPSRERPGFFFRLSPESLILGAGMHAFSDQALERYRSAVLAEHSGTALDLAAQQCPSPVGGRTYKRVPSGLPNDHPRADWLRHSGLFAERELQPVPTQVFSFALLELCLEHYERMAPLQRWLVELLPG